MWEMTHKALSLYLFDFKKHILDGEEEPNIETINEIITNQMKSTFEISKHNDYSDFIDFWLAEHFYEEIEDNSLDTVIQKVITNLESFIASDYHKHIEEWLHKWHHIYIEDPKRPNFDMMKVDTKYIPGLENISLLAGPDFWLMFGEKNYLILDWKSGKEKMDISGITDQLRVYALKILLKQKTTELWDRTIDVYEVYLPSLHEKKWRIEQEDINAIIQKMSDDVEYQKQFVVEQDIERNEPLEHTAFTRTSNEKKCVWCTFRAVCQQLKELETSN